MKILPASALFALPFAIVCRGAQVSIPALKDATLYESEGGSLANGAGDTLFVGRTGQQAGSLRRAVIEFDIQSMIPPGAVINSVTLTLHASNSRASGSNFSVHRLTKEWTEGTTVAGGNGGGGGFPVAGNDVTWVHASAPDSFWSGPGAAGDFIGTATSTALVGGPSGFYSWTGLAGDVQLWLNDSSTNHGWILTGNESLSNSAVRFESRTHAVAENRPVLVVDFTPVPEPGSAAMLASGLLVLLQRRRR